MRSDDWVPVVTYSAVHEADFAMATLTSAGIPARVVGADHVGIFGPGWAGFSPRGLTVTVPPDRSEEAQTLLDVPPPEPPPG